MGWSPCCYEKSGGLVGSSVACAPQGDELWKATTGKIVDGLDSAVTAPADIHVVALMPLVRTKMMICEWPR
jgi:hypothetical protein